MIHSFIHKPVRQQCALWAVCAFLPFVCVCIHTHSHCLLNLPLINNEAAAGAVLGLNTGRSTCAILSQTKRKLVSEQVQLFISVFTFVSRCLGVFFLSSSAGWDSLLRCRPVRAAGAPTLPGSFVRTGHLPIGLADAPRPLIGQLHTMPYRCIHGLRRKSVWRASW